MDQDLFAPRELLTRKLDSNIMFKLNSIQKTTKGYLFDSISLLTTEYLAKPKASSLSKNECLESKY